MPGLLADLDEIVQEVLYDGCRATEEREWRQAAGEGDALAVLVVGEAVALVEE